MNFSTYLDWIYIFFIFYFILLFIFINDKWIVKIVLGNKEEY